MESRSALLDPRTGYGSKAPKTLTLRGDGSPPRKTEKGLNLIHVGESLPSFFRVLQKNTVAENPTGRVLGEALWVPLSSSKFIQSSSIKSVDSTGEVMGVFTFFHSSNSFL